MITSEVIFWLLGALFLVSSGLILADRHHPRRITSGAFWGLLGAGFIYGTWVAAGSAPAWILGAVVLVIVALGSTRHTLRAGAATTTGPAQRAASAARLGNRLFLPALCIPVVVVAVTLLAPMLRVGDRPLLEPSSATLIGLGAGAAAGLGAGYLLLRPRPLLAPAQEARRLLEAIGWTALLPPLLTVLGVLFVEAGVGRAVGTVLGGWLPPGVLLAAVITYCLGMALFTVVLGNAFAAFPIMTAAIGWPELVQAHHGDPSAVFAIGMLAAFCGSLCTPMAANFNVVPAALLEMRNRYGVIVAQLPTAGLMLAANILIMYLFAFPR